MYKTVRDSDAPVYVMSLIGDSVSIDIQGIDEEAFT